MLNLTKFDYIASRKIRFLWENGGFCFLWENSGMGIRNMVIIKHMKRCLLTILFLCALGTGGYAAPEIDTLRVYFRLGYSTLEPGLRNNERALKHLVERMRAVSHDPHRQELMIWAEGNASPDGSARANLRLSRKRAEGLLEYLRSRVPMDDFRIRVKAEGVDWAGLAAFVEHDPSVPERERVLKILRETPEWIYDGQGRIVDGRKRQLMNLRGGTVYHLLKERFFADLRNASIALQSDRPAAPQPQAPSEPESPAASDSLSAPSAASELPAAPEMQPQVPPVSESPAASLLDSGEPAAAANPAYRLAVKTNLLYDAALMPSLEVEYRIRDRWTVNLEGDVAWWKNARKHKYYQLATISPEGRWWFGQRKNSPWHGHYIGLFGGYMWYDLENGRQGYRGDAEMAGVSYGYMFPIGRRLSLEAGIGVGYLHCRYKEYLPEPYLDGTHYVYRKTSTLDYFGPLKLKFALVWHLWDADKRKGGGE